MAGRGDTINQSSKAPPLERRAHLIHHNAFTANPQPHISELLYGATERKRRHSALSLCLPVIHYLVVNIIISERLLYLVCRDLRHVNLRLLSLQELIITVSLCSSSRVSRVCQELIITVSLCSSSRVSRVCQVIHYLVVNIIISERLLYLVCRDLRQVNLRLLSLQELTITVSLCSSSRVSRVCQVIHYIVVNIIISERLLYLVCRDLRQVNLRLLSLQELIITVSLCSSSCVENVQTGFHS
ncbi:hypothetical protein J6590_103907 [Homalodisca vitripennis]|nr:hypothetical protein J6590_103907 [Homalodisca vitripennis]